MRRHYSWDASRSKGSPQPFTGARGQARAGQQAFCWEPHAKREYSGGAQAGGQASRLALAYRPHRIAYKASLSSSRPGGLRRRQPLPIDRRGPQFVSLTLRLRSLGSLATLASVRRLRVASMNIRIPRLSPIRPSTLRPSAQRRVCSLRTVSFQTLAIFCFRAHVASLF